MNRRGFLGAAASAALGVAAATHLPKPSEPVIGVDLGTDEGSFATEYTANEGALTIVDLQRTMGEMKAASASFTPGGARIVSIAEYEAMSQHEKAALWPGHYMEYGDHRQPWNDD